LNLVRDKKNISAISEIIGGVLGKLEKQKNSSKEEMELCWRKLAGEKAFVHSRPVSMRKKVLTVRVDTSAWLEALTLDKRKLLKGLKRQLGKDKISTLHFKIGEF
jgi:predicted nucleic acid-binding Zn ribbon protein